MLQRDRELTTLRSLLRRHPVVGIIGVRQVGKTTLARTLMRGEPQPTHRFDLENPEDLARLAEPMLALKSLRGLVVIDEIQRTATPVMTRSAHVAIEDLKLQRLDVIHAGDHSFALAQRARAIAIARLFDESKPLA